MRIPGSRDGPAAWVEGCVEGGACDGPLPDLRRPVTGTVAVKLSRCAACPSDADPELLDRLRGWRASRAKEQKVPAFVIFTDATLTAIAEQRSANAAGLSAIPGIGSAKLDRYGEEVLALVRGDPATG